MKVSKPVFFLQTDTIPLPTYQMRNILGIAIHLAVYRAMSVLYTTKPYLPTYLLNQYLLPIQSFSFSKYFLSLLYSGVYAQHFKLFAYVQYMPMCITCLCAILAYVHYLPMCNYYAYVHFKLISSNI